jgi:uncharacterized Zn finger protein
MFLARRRHMSYWGFRPYVSVAQRKAKAAREVAKLKKKGRTITPVVVEGRAIATTFWGKAWCDNLESYSDFANRLPRGRTYVRNGSVCDLQIEAGRVTAMVCGSELYRITIKIEPLAAATWKAVKAACAGQIGSLVELLQGRLSKGVMEVVTRPGEGLFPRPREIKLSCSCPDWADLCKHVAAALYGVGARLDERPELLFTLRQVDHLELVAEAGDAAVRAPGAGGAPSGAKTIDAGDLADVFGIELDGGTAPEPVAAPTVTKEALTAPPTAKPRRGKRRPAASPVASGNVKSERVPERGKSRKRVPARETVKAAHADKSDPRPRTPARRGAGKEPPPAADPPRRRRKAAVRLASA